jgi:dihydroorotase
VPPDVAGVYSGVTTVIDGGSAGYMTFADFRERWLNRSITDSYALLHLNPVGQFTLPELWDMKRMAVNPECAVAILMENRDRLLGLKVRAIGSMIEDAGFETFVAAKKICERCSLPLVVHIGLDPDDSMSDERVDAFTRDLLSLLDAGDCVAHAYTGKRGGLFVADERFLPLIQTASKRGVIFDACVGRTNFSKHAFERALSAGYKPDIISTDLTIFGKQAVGKNFSVALSKFLALGLSLSDIVAMTTRNPARAFFPGKEKGSLHVGSIADVTLFTVEEGEFQFYDAFGGTAFSGVKRVVPRQVFRKGVLYGIAHAEGPTF